MMVKRSKNPVSPNDRRRWLDALEKGRGITAIAQGANRDIRVVKRHIDIAKEEQLIANTKHDFLLGRVEKHQDTLLEEVQRLKQLIQRYPPVTLKHEDLMKQKINEGFLDHIKKLGLKKLLQSYSEVVELFMKTRETIKVELISKEEKILERIPEGLITYPWAQELLEIIETGLPVDETFGRKYEKERQSEKLYKIKWGSGDLLSTPIFEANVPNMIDLHSELISYVRNYQPVFQEHRQRIKEISDLIIEELNTLIIKRIVPGQCRYCPI